MSLNLSPNGTFLNFTPVGTLTPVLTPYGARGITQTYELINGGGGAGGPWLRRDVQGALQDLSDVAFRKIRSTITCRDGESPCLNNAWIGVEVIVDCAFELSYPTSGGSPHYTVVSASSRTQGSVTYYRPQITMRVAAIKSTFQEYQGIYNWQIDLEEI